MNKTSASIGTKDLEDRRPGATTGSAPKLKVAKIGIVSRDYNYMFSNGYRDFSAEFPRVLQVLDEKHCDAVLFSPWSIVPRPTFNPLQFVRGLQHVRSVFCEEFIIEQKRWVGQRFVVFYHQGSKWYQRELSGGGFGELRGSWEAKRRKVQRYTREVLPGRILGNSCVMICGETNGVPYDQEEKKVKDGFGLRRAVPDEVNVIVNPVHDWMSRFEMKLKREFLSRENRWVVSVWNRGKRDRGGRRRDALGHPWTVYHDGQCVTVEALAVPETLENIEIGIVDTRVGKTLGRVIKPQES
jgi:hypothetical protein